MSAWDWSKAPEPWRSIGPHFAAEAPAIARGEEYVPWSPRWSTDQAAALRGLWLDPALTETEIGRRVGGKSRSAVGRKAHRMGLGRKPGRDGHR